MRAKVDLNKLRRDAQPGDNIYVFSWKDGTHIGGAVAPTILEAKKQLWATLKALGHEHVMKELRKGVRYKITVIPYK
jgi:hypothetical protein